LFNTENHIFFSSVLEVIFTDLIVNKEQRKSANQGVILTSNRSEGKKKHNEIINGSHRVDELRDDCVRAALGRAGEKCLKGRKFVSHDTYRTTILRCGEQSTTTTGLPKLSIKRREFRQRGIQRVEHNVLAINDDVRAKTKLRHSTIIQGSKRKGKKETTTVSSTSSTDSTTRAKRRNVIRI
uniref:Uncharacterized protein n=1 Tax=Brugia timori TaxID=42155 RepID=A0A0R3QD32_9BILA